jgi:hypothetical protein
MRVEYIMFLLNLSEGGWGEEEENNIDYSLYNTILLVDYFKL